MTSRQRALRYAFWRGFAITLLAVTGFCAVSGLAGTIAG